jgi:voltage-gated potassium channel
VSLLSVINLAIGAVSLGPIHFSGPTGEVVFVMDALLTPVFLMDFLYRLTTAHSRRAYFFMQSGWIDMLAVLPILRVLRLVRVVQVWRWMRRRGSADILAELDANRAIATFLFTVFLVFLVVEIAGVTILIAEGSDPNANIHSAQDAIWWGLVTITTVGYGDRVPVTEVGRIIGVFLLFAGIALFSVLTGFIANFFIAPRRSRLRRGTHDETTAALLSMHQLLAEQDERSQLMHQRLDELERRLIKDREQTGQSAS